MNDYPMRIKRLIREFAAEAYEKELSRELARLDKSFSEWRDGKINSGELSHRIHQYETGASRELFKKYNEGENDFNVAYAIVTGILDRRCPRRSDKGN
jgi:DNA primase large subunit